MRAVEFDAKTHARREAQIVDTLRAASVELARRSDFLYLDAIQDLATSLGPLLQYYKRDFLFRSGEWRGQTVSPINLAGSGKVLVVGHSDRPVRSWDLLKIAAYAAPKSVFCANLTAAPMVARALRSDYLPLGLTNPTNESTNHEIFGDWRLVRDVALEPGPAVRPTEHQVYANFRTSNAPKHRQQLAELCGTTNHVVVGSMEISAEGRLRYLRGMRQAGLVVCPEGNGADTHRFYEALYVGAIPIVLSASYAAKLADRFRLPHITVSTWADISNLPGLQRRAEKLRSEYCDLSWIMKSTWVKKLSVLVT